MRLVPLFALLLMLSSATPSWAQRGWRSRRQTAPPPPPADSSSVPPADSSVVPSGVKTALASATASTTPPEEIPEPPAVAKGPPTVYYFDGRMHWCLLPDDRVLVWTGSKWVPPGVIYWGAADRIGEPSARAASSPGPWIHSRFNVESRDYRSRYGNDAWFRYGQGHFLD